MRERGTAWILGAGSSGMAAARLLRQHGWSLKLLDQCPESELGARATELRELGVEVLCGAGELPAGHPDYVIVSPGVPLTSPWLVEAQRRGLRLMSELELGARFLACPYIAVTGSKGKSTLVKLLADTLNRAGLRAAAGGNYGVPASTLALAGDLDWAVLECSSFQLETATGLKPRIAIMLNFSPDHLDRHGTMAEYRDLKLRLPANQTDDDLTLVTDHSDPWGFRQEAQAASRGRVELFGRESTSEWLYRAGGVYCRSRPSLAVTGLEGSPFDNAVMGPGLAAAVATLTHIGLSPGRVAEGIKNFVPLPHRLQEIARVGGVRFVNDSKATSFAAQAAALQIIKGPKLLIAGGVLKGENAGDAKELLTAGVKKVYLIGQSSEVLAAAWSRHLEVELCGSLERAVTLAGDEAVAGDVVLLSPGAGSFDQFLDFADRGDQFAALVKKLIKERQLTQEKKQ